MSYLVNPSNNKGSALLTALFIMTIVAIAATMMSVRLQSDIRRTQLVLEHDKRFNASHYSLDYAFLKLSEVIKKSTKNKKVFEPQTRTHRVKDQGIIIDTTIIDLQSRFDVNRLANKKDIHAFVLLLQQVLPKMSLLQARHIAFALHFWLSPLTLGQGLGPLDKHYLSLNPAYSASHQPMVSISELRLIDGITAKHYHALKPFITTLASKNPINLRTASPQLLKTLGAGLSDSQVKALVEFRKKKQGSLLSALKDDPKMKALQLPIKQLTELSQFFLVKSTVTNNDGELQVFYTVKRTIKKKKIILELVQLTLNAP